MTTDTSTATTVADQPVHTDTPATVLRRAADYLQAHGWTWGTRYEERDETPPAADVVGAIRIAVVGDPVHDAYDSPDQATTVARSLATLTTFLRLDQAAIRGDVIEALTEWNDTVPINTGEVVTALHYAALWYEQQAAAYAANYTSHLLGSAAGR